MVIGLRLPADRIDVGALDRRVGVEAAGAIENAEPVAVLAAVVAHAEGHVAGQLLLEADVELLAVRTGRAAVDGREQAARKAGEGAELPGIERHVAVGVGPGHGLVDDGVGIGGFRDLRPELIVEAAVVGLQGGPAVAEQVVGEARGAARRSARNRRRRPSGSCGPRRRCRPDWSAPAGARSRRRSGGRR